MERGFTQKPVRCQSFSSQIPCSTSKRTSIMQCFIHLQQLGIYGGFTDGGRVGALQHATIPQSIRTTENLMPSQWFLCEGILGSYQQKTGKKDGQAIQERPRIWDKYFLPNGRRSEGNAQKWIAWRPRQIAPFWTCLKVVNVYCRPKPYWCVQSLFHTMESELGVNETILAWTIGMRRQERRYLQLTIRGNMPALYTDILPQGYMYEGRETLYGCI